MPPADARSSQNLPSELPQSVRVSFMHRLAKPTTHDTHHTDTLPASDESIDPSICWDERIMRGRSFDRSWWTGQDVHAEVEPSRHCSSLNYLDGRLRLEQAQARKPSMLNTPFLPNAHTHIRHRQPKLPWRRRPRPGNGVAEEAGPQPCYRCCPRCGRWRWSFCCWCCASQTTGPRCVRA